MSDQQEKTTTKPHSIGVAKTFWEHIAELRYIFLFSFAAVVFFALISHAYYEQVITFLLRPLGGKDLVFLSPLDPILFILKIDTLMGVLLSLPLILFLIFRFIAPAVPTRLLALTRILLVSAVVLVLLAIVYTYFVFTPITLSFLQSISVPGIQIMITAQNYLNFLFAQVLLNILISQLPIIIFLCTATGVVTPQYLSKQRKMIYLGSVIFLSIITPTTDLFTLSLVLLPTVAIFEISIVIAKIFTKRT
jgi:sec-independent protein translocase protein TatC